VGQDPLRHGDPDPARRLLRDAHPEILPARQRVPDLPSVPDRTGVPPRAARAPRAHPDAHRQGQGERANPRRRDEQGRPDQPRPHDRRDRPRTDRCSRCELTTPHTCERQHEDDLYGPATGPWPRCDASMPTASRSRSRPSPVRPESPGPGSTTRPTYEPRSNDYAAANRSRQPRPPLSVSAPRRTPCSAGSRPPPNASGDSSARTRTCATPSPERSEPPGPLESSKLRHLATRPDDEPRNSSDRAEPAPNPATSKTPSTTHHRRSTPRATGRLEITEGRWARAEALSSAMTFSMMAWSRWVASAASIDSAESVKTAWWRQMENRAPCPAGTVLGFRRLTRRTINRAPMCSLWRREVNAVNSISATSASDTQRCSCSS